jgi:hypothetical protein
MFKSLYYEIYSELKLNISILLTICGLSIISILLYDSLLYEMYDNIYQNVIFVFFITPISLILGYNKSKMMTLSSKLPNTLFEIYIGRLIKLLIFPLICILLLLVINFFDKNALIFTNILNIIIFSIMIFGYLVFFDMKIITQNYTWLKKYFLILISILVLFAISAIFIYILKTFNFIHDNYLFGLSILIINYIAMTYYSYSLFKLRKNYKY